MADYTEEIGLTLELLAEFGTPMTYASITEDMSGNFDPETGYPIVVVKTPFIGVKRQPKLEEIQMGLFQLDSTVVIAPAEITDGKQPDTTDVIQFGGRDWDIVTIVRLAPAESVIAYKISVQDAGEMDTSERLRIREV